MNTANTSLLLNLTQAAKAFEGGEPAVTRMLARPGGLNGLWCWLLFLLNPELKNVGVCFRERDLSYFGLEDCPSLQVTCVPFEGEIPALYSITPPVGAFQAYAASALPASFLSLVDFVAGATGSGVGIALTGDLVSKEATDLQTGRRVRYRYTKAARMYGGAPLYWVERTESGQSESYAVVSQMTRLGPR
jgi:hypothetical protein